MIVHIPASATKTQDQISKVFSDRNKFDFNVIPIIANANRIVDQFKYQETTYSENFAIFFMAIVPPALKNGLIMVRVQMTHIGMFDYRTSLSLESLAYPKIVNRIAARLTAMMQESKHISCSLNIKRESTNTRMGQSWLMTELMEAGMYFVTE